ncbi:MAG: SAM-dependent methyltransferase, partial [Stackebrandtia sp.]
MDDNFDSAADPAIDMSKSSVARAYDFFLGGKDNFEVDRIFAEKIMERDPDVRTTARLNKEFGRRAVDY